MRTGTTARSIAVTGAALLAITACGGGGDDEGGDTGADSGEKVVNIYGTDGNMGNALGEDFTEEGSLAGMKGTTPLTDLSSTTQARPTTRSSSRRWRPRRPEPTRPRLSRPTSTA